jgi:hypothetical protein
MKGFILAAAIVVLATGCSTMTPARYAVSADNNEILRQYSGAKVHVGSVASTVPFEPNCRAMGPIEASDGMTIPEFIQKAFNDELKMSGIYAADGRQLRLVITKLAFSSTARLTNGWWDIGLTLSSPDGKQVAVENRYDFKSGFDGATACNQTAQALGAAVQDVIKKAITQPHFRTLLH